MGPDDIGGVRKLLQDIVTPSMKALQEKVSTLADECKKLGQSIEQNTDRILQLTEKTHTKFAELERSMRDRTDERYKEVRDAVETLSGDFGEFRGMFDGAKREMAAELRIELIKHFRPPPSGGTGELPPAGS